MPTTPILIRNHLHPTPAPKPLLILHGDCVFAPEPALLTLMGNFTDDGRGGFLGAGMAHDGFGYIDGRGQWVVPPTLQEARGFSADGLARFCDQGLWGYRDLTGAVVIAPQFAEARAFNHGLAAVQVGKRWRYLDLQGAYAFDADFFVAGDFSEAGLAIARAKLSDKYGFIDRKGNWVIAPQFQHALGFSRHGVAPASIDGRKMGLIDGAGQWIVAPTYSSIEQFNEDGYAYCYTSIPGSLARTTYLNSSGQEVIPAQEDLSRHMQAGLVRKRDNRYVRLEGELATSVPIYWGGGFTSHGFTVARAHRAERDSREPGDRDEAWGILRADGVFQPSLPAALEPLTDGEGAMIWPEPGTPLIPFATLDQNVALLDQDAKVVYRLEREVVDAMECASLRDATGRLLWRGAPCVALARAKPFFDPEGDQLLEGLTQVAHIGSLAQTLLAQTGAKLHAFTAGTLPLHQDDSGEQDDNPDEDEYEGNREDYDGDDPDGAPARIRTSQRVLRAFIDESTWGAYAFLSEQRLALTGRTYRHLVEHLSAAFGPPSSDPDYAGRAAGESTLAWAFGDDPERLWLGIRAHDDCMGGTIWCHIWLHCAPSVATMAAAMEAAPPHARGEDDDEDEQDCAPESDNEPRTYQDRVEQVGGYDGWLGEIDKHANAVAAVPAHLLDDAMADAAIRKDPEAYAHLPAAFQTPARLEAIIRSGAHDAARIPCECMTAEALALARSLHSEERQWHWADEERSLPPELPLDLNSLYSYWGCLVDAQLALDAVQAGVALSAIPRWLHSDALVDAALRHNISNLRGLDPNRITRAMAEQAVAEPYSDLIAYIPRALLTPALCRESVRVSGRSLQYVPNELITVPLCLAAIEADDDAFDFVPNPLRDAVRSALGGGQ